MVKKIYIIGISQCFDTFSGENYKDKIKTAIKKIGYFDTIFARKIDLNLIEDIKKADGKFKNSINKAVVLYDSKIKFIIKYLKENTGKKNILILAGGDPNFFGVGGTVLKNVDKNFVEIYPSVSFAQIAFLRLKIPMEDSIIVSLHGRSMKNLFSPLYSSKNIGLFTDDYNNPARIYDFLEEKGFRNDFNFHVLSNLCEKDEEIYSVNSSLINLNDDNDKDNSKDKTKDKGKGGSKGKDVSIFSGKSSSAAENSDLNKIHLERFTGRKNIVILERKSGSEETADGIKTAGRITGFEDEDFFHADGEPTKKEIRAVSLSMLELRKDLIMIDAGCGSGSISIEASGIVSEGVVYAIDKDSAKIKNLKKNIKKFKRPNIEPILGKLPDVLNEIKDKPDGKLIIPDRIFIGGGSFLMENILKTSFKILKINGIIVVNCIMLDSFNRVMLFLKHLENRDPFLLKFEIISLSVSKLKTISNDYYFKALNQIYLIKILKLKDF